ncbi:MAG TPA: PKD domain-containing protein [Bacteroides sp.]|nr:PKD domain-containing protein [Bacteroides sp.]
MNPYDQDWQFLRMVRTVPFVVILVAIACNRLPEPDFHFVAEENPEAGDSIVFINSTRNADSYAWEFGDGGTSSLESPVYIYDRAGIFDVKLTALNDAGEESVSRTLTIHEPTELGFFVYDSTGKIALAAAEVWVYDNEEEWNNFDDPLIAGTTDNQGFVNFMNMDPLVYYIWVFKEEATGFWVSGGYTSPLVRHEKNYYNVLCTWFTESSTVPSTHFTTATTRSSRRGP